MRTLLASVIVCLAINLPMQRADLPRRSRFAARILRRESIARAPSSGNNAMRRVKEGTGIANPFKEADTGPSSAPRFSQIEAPKTQSMTEALQELRLNPAAKKALDEVSSLLTFTGPGPSPQQLRASLESAQNNAPGDPYTNQQMFNAWARQLDPRTRQATYAAQATEPYISPYMPSPPYGPWARQQQFQP